MTELWQLPTLLLMSIVLLNPVVISLILQSLSVEDAEQKVIHQLLEFAHRTFFWPPSLSFLTHQLMSAGTKGQKETRLR